MTDDPGFWDTLWRLIPLALAGTFSWLPVTGVVVLLLAHSSMTKVWPFVVGRAFGLALITVAFVAAARALPAPCPGTSPGGACLAARLGEASVPAVFLTSVVVDLQPKGLVLRVASGVVVRAGSMPVPEAVLAVVVYLVVAASSVVLPVVATQVASVRTARWLRVTRDWLTRNGSVLTAVVAALVGVVLVVDGLGRF